MAMFGYNCDVMLCDSTGTVLFDASGHIDKKQNFLDYISDNIIFIVSGGMSSSFSTSSLE